MFFFLFYFKRQNFTLKNIKSLLACLRGYLSLRKKQKRTNTSLEGRVPQNKKGLKFLIKFIFCFWVEASWEQVDVDIIRKDLWSVGMLCVECCVGQAILKRKFLGEEKVMMTKTWTTCLVGGGGGKKEKKDNTKLFTSFTL